MKFHCGCEFDELDWDRIPLDCQATWDMIGEGLTKGVFQLEKSLGRKWCKRIKPRTIEELADVISIIRPGPLEAKYREDPKTGKMLSIAETYVAVKRRELDAEYIHESLEPILYDTHGVPIYQEQVMKICENFAGFSLEEADDARKAVGKKLIDKMEEVKKKFIDGAVSKGEDKEIAETIFGWIDKFSGYGFNKSHAVGYAMMGYRTAYAKIHFPVEFFKSMLTYSTSKQDEHDEINQLINEAKLFGIEILLPDVRHGNAGFKFLENKIIFGLAHIKGIGASAVSELSSLKDVESEEDIFRKIYIDDVKVKKNVLEALICSGALDYAIQDRIRTLGRFKMLGALTPREVVHLHSQGLLGSPSSDWHKNLVDNKIPRPFEKRLERINAAWDDVKNQYTGSRLKQRIVLEKFYLGMAISVSEAELYSSDVDTITCEEFLSARDKSKVSIIAYVEEVKEIKDRKGNWMCFMRISDGTYLLDGVVCFSRAYDKYSWIIGEGKVLLISGRKQDTSLLVDSVKHV